MVSPSRTAPTKRANGKEVVHKTAKSSPPPTKRAAPKRGRKASPAPEGNGHQNGDAMQIDDGAAPAPVSRTASSVDGGAKKAKKVKPAFQLEPRYTQVGEVWVCGSGDTGQLGLGATDEEQRKPRCVKTIKDEDIVAVFAGGLHSVALTKEGKLWSWGCNDDKALGRSGEENEPEKVQGLDDEFVVQVACADSATAVLTKEGKVYAWGTFRTANGLFGFSADAKTKKTVSIQETPVLVDELKDKHIIDINAGVNHFVAIDDGGKVYTWGDYMQNQLGRKPTPRNPELSALTPRVCNFSRKKFTNAFCGAYHTFLVNDTECYAFGLNNYGQLGVGEDEVSEGKVYPVTGYEGKVAMIAAGDHHSLLLNDQGKIYAFGRSDSGQLGLGEEASALEPPSVNIPTPLTKLSNKRITQISAGSAFSLAVSDESGNNIYGWGFNECGQLTGASDQEDEPHQPQLNGRKVYMIAGGGQHTLFLLNRKQPVN
ncbi:Regulator of chromosome condensation [Rhizophlyctis rosea]|nr:Regulator of chromosome condensation [Rhizophlyctis rosea]